MPSKKTPAERGFRTVLLSKRSADALDDYKGEHGLSASGAVLRLMSDAEPKDQLDWELLFRLCRVDAATQQRIREHVEMLNQGI